jgi:crotonobetainyl-CoA:carnitine CoA-transferase CaiB-like acyl-CoA transferase
MDDLIKTADVFFANRRVGYLEKYGLSANDMAKIRPGIIHATVSLFGEEGPWASHGGFDVSAGVATGIMAMEGTLENPPDTNLWIPTSSPLTPQWENIRA